jgi:ferredoxin
VMAAMAGAEPSLIPTTRIAAKRGLGPCRIQEIDVNGDFEPIRGFRLPSSRMAAGMAGLAAAIAYPLIERRPLLSRDLCTKCGGCADNCPVGAIAMSPFPVIDRKGCIMCFCCAELCPSRALNVPGLLRGFVQRVTGR